jgi:hypothetical protein
LEAVEEEGGAAGVDFVGSEADDDFAEGFLEGFGVGGRGDAEAVTGVAGVGVGDGGAVGVVVVAEGLGAEGGGAAAVVVWEEVAAAGCAIGVGGHRGHRVGASPRVLFGAKVLR